jgi:hypothetical protein
MTKFAFLLSLVAFTVSIVAVLLCLWVGPAHAQWLPIPRPLPMPVPGPMPPMPIMCTSMCTLNMCTMICS